MVYLNKIMISERKKKMIANFHTHTYRCNHAQGTDREYVEAAIRAGVKVLGFSDHSPYWFPTGYYSTHRMKPDEIEDYVNSVLALKEEYKNDIKIHLGFEAEYYPLYFDKMLEMIAPYPYEYLILGQHFLENEKAHSHVVKPGLGYDALSTYVNECIAGLATGKFFYFAHPDVLNFGGSPEVYRSEMLRLCRAAKKMNVPLEINLLGIREKRAYPRMDFWKIAAEVGNDVIFGSDSHTPDATALAEDIKAGMEIVNACKLHLIEPTAPKI